jgi:hypothetical protein
MKKLIFILLLTISTISINAQNSEILLKTGFINRQITITNDKGLLKHPISFYELNKFEAAYNYTTIDNLVFGTGTGYYVYWESSCFKEGGLSGMTIYRSISIPLQLGYKFEIFPNFNLTYSSGIDIDIYFDKYNGYKRTGNLITNSNMLSYMVYYDNSVKRSFNMLLSQSLNLSYLIKNRVSVNLFCSYHSGLFEVLEATGEVKTIEETPQLICNPIITSNGSYFNVGIGIGYVFGK